MWPRLTSGELWLASSGDVGPRPAMAGRGTPATGLALLAVLVMTAAAQEAEASGVSWASAAGVLGVLGVLGPDSAEGPAGCGG